MIYSGRFVIVHHTLSVAKLLFTWSLLMLGIEQGTF